MKHLPTKLPKSKRGANRQWIAIVREYKRRFEGWDWPTFRLNWPEAWQYVQELRAVYYSLPD